MPRKNTSIASDISTLCHHIESYHKVSSCCCLGNQFSHVCFQGLYYAWCEKNNFSSKLPKDVQKHKEDEASMSQSQLDSHLHER
jgi:hypothetical protein